jgi:hypothetical protein
VTPGIRPQGSEVGDQRRIMTPEQALAAGVDYMVIGRPVTHLLIRHRPCAILTLLAWGVMSDNNSRLVYSTETGRINEEKAPVERAKGDGVVRMRQTSGRKGRGMPDHRLR